MKSEENYIKINKESWNNRTDVHIKSDFYDMDGFMYGKSSLKSIELDLLGDVSGKSILHLQCHFGQDTLSLSRMGAKVTGVDLSDNAIKIAQDLTKKLNADAEFICCDLYDLPNHLNKTFDIVFTSYGTITWLPDLDKWAAVVSKFLKPEGKFVFAEFHPVVWMFDDAFEKIEYNYFKNEAIETLEGSYTESTTDAEQQFITWNHSLSEVFTSLLNNGLQINSFKEYDYSPYNCFQKTIEFEPSKFRIEHLGNNIPMVYSLTATKI